MKKGLAIASKLSVLKDKAGRIVLTWLKSSFRHRHRGWVVWVTERLREDDVVRGVSDLENNFAVGH